MPYIGKSPSVGVRNRFYFTASGGETSLSGADSGGRIFTFSDGKYVDVMLNGVTLVAGTDYNTTTANTIAGLAALTASDIIEIVVYDVFSVPDAVSAVNGGTFQNNIYVTGTVTADGLDVQGDGTISGGSRLTISDIADVNNDGIRLDDNTTGRFNNLTQDTSGNFKIQHWTGSAWQNNFTLSTDGKLGLGTTSPASYGRLAVMTPTANYGYFGIGNSVGGGGGVNIGSFYGTTKISYIDTVLENGTPSSEQSRLQFATIAGGTLTERMRIDSSGRVTMPYQPSFMAYGGFAYQASTYIWQGFGIVDHNIGGHWNNSIGRFTAPVAGKYMIYATVYHQGAGTYHLWAFRKNGTAGGSNWVQSYDSSGGDATTSKQQVWNLAAGDYLEVASNSTYANAYLGGYVAVGVYLIG